MKTLILANNCETCVSMKKEANDLHETLSKFTKGSENLNLVISNKIISLNKNGLGFKSNRSLIIRRNLIVLFINALYVIILAT